MGLIVLFWLIRFISTMTVFHHTSRDLNENLCCIFPLFDILRPLWSLVRQMQYQLRKKKELPKENKERIHKRIRLSSIEQLEVNYIPQM